MNPWIVVQGQSDWPFIESIIKGYAQYPNVIWSTWRDTLTEKVEEILYQTEIPTLANDYPERTGRAHINYQCKSTLAGIEYAKSKGATHILKTRTDLLIPKINDLMTALKQMEKPVNPYCYDFITQGACDLMVYGTAPAMETYWNVNNIEGFAERILLIEYFQKIGKPLPEWPNWDINEIRKEIGFFKGTAKKAGVDFEWLKYPDRSPLSRHLGNDQIYPNE
jgi:hypothetical protein